MNQCSKNQATTPQVLYDYYIFSEKVKYRPVEIEYNLYIHRVQV